MCHSCVVEGGGRAKLSRLVLFLDCSSPLKNVTKCSRMLIQCKKKDVGATATPFAPPSKDATGNTVTK